MSLRSRDEPARLPRRVVISATLTWRFIALAIATFFPRRCKGLILSGDEVPALERRLVVV
jgi:hypothetical protein